MFGWFAFLFLVEASSLSTAGREARIRTGVSPAVGWSVLWCFLDAVRSTGRICRWHGNFRTLGTFRCSAILVVDDPQINTGEGCDFHRNAIIDCVMWRRKDCSPNQRSVNHIRLGNENFCKLRNRHRTLYGGFTHDCLAGGSITGMLGTTNPICPPAYRYASEGRNIFRDEIGMVRDWVSRKEGRGDGGRIGPGLVRICRRADGQGFPDTGVSVLRYVRQGSVWGSGVGPVSSQDRG
jgi:hypothetical protein